MSYTVQFYLGKIDKIKKLIGSKKTAILDELDIDDEEREYAETLLMGTEQDPESGSEYGYALEKIVEHLFGESEGVSEFEELHFADFEDSPLSWLSQSGPPVELPLNEDFPVIGHRYLADMEKTLDDWTDEKLENFNLEVQKMLEGMLSVFQNAVDSKRDIITFYY
jgi:hypothetical protein